MATSVGKKIIKRVADRSRRSDINHFGAVLSSVALYLAALPWTAIA